MPNPGTEEWHIIDQRIRERDGNCCTVCGVPNRAEVMRAPNSDAWRLIDQIRGSDIGFLEDRGGRVVTIVLVVVHLDHTLTNNDEANLTTLCQQHALAHNRIRNLAKARETRQTKHGLQPRLEGLTG